MGDLNLPDLPAPLVPAECDCTDLDGFMLNVERLMASELVALSSHEVVGAALFLWCRAWKQRPAASLPDDDRVLSAYAKLPLARFRKLRSEVLRGFVKCSDGRLYHRVLAPEAVKAWDRKASFRKKRETDAERLRRWRASGGETGRETTGETVGETVGETASETRFVAEGQGQGQGQKEGESVATSTAGTERANPEVRSPKRANGVEGYAFEGRHIRLNHPDFAEWERAYSHLSLRAELMALDEWAGEQGSRWFPAVSAALAKKERAAVERLAIERQRSSQGGHPVQDPRL